MLRYHAIFVCCWCAVQALLVAPVYADFVPTHGDVVHMDPFIPGWPVPPTFPPPPPGVVVPGDGAGADPEYNVLGPHTTDVLTGTDDLDSPLGNWHWEIEIDLDPYGGLAPGVPVTFDFSPLGGPILGPFGVPIVAGPDIYIDVDQPDHNNGLDPFNEPPPPFPEMGDFSKALVNETDDPVAWGTSVTEDLTPSGPPGVHTPWFDLEKDLGFGIWRLEPDVAGGIRIIQLPEPATLSLLGLGALMASRRRRS